LAADAAGRGGVEAPLDAGAVEGARLDLDRVRGEVGRGRRRRRRDPLRDAEAEGELLVVAGGPHRDGERLAGDPDLERLLDRDDVHVGPPARHPRQLDPGGAVGQRVGHRPGTILPGTMATDLSQTARALVAPGKGILAADESTGTIKRRFDAIGVESTEETRRAYRDLLFTAEGAERWISGVILFDETIRQSSADGTPFPELLASKGVIPGIKVDKGAKPLANAPGETITEGLDGLRERFEEYVSLGARFAKWRAVYSIGDGRPS